jgi:hypothetical protein
MKTQVTFWKAEDITLAQKRFQALAESRSPAESFQKNASLRILGLYLPVLSSSRRFYLAAGFSSFPHQASDCFMLGRRDRERRSRAMWEWMREH